MCGKTVLTVHAELDVIYDLFLGRSKHMIRQFADHASSSASSKESRHRKQSKRSSSTSKDDKRSTNRFTATNRANRRHPKKHKDKSIDIFVVKVNQSGTLTESRPCVQCVYTMKCAGIRKCYYSTHDGNITVEKVEHMFSDYVCMGQTRCLNEIELLELKLNETRITGQN